ncbi:MFS transporter [Herbiconiux sp. KACC 21604]|uniref:MFS transporter n=1 Tax=unclassified Herbiconiux TaxID=2618217 RepID=UPI001491E996|nr:MFS transporter [Herbiconiux sp. SALV-R1]QJU55218.1 MFS transporter [Herbiconiux sp. SALV-R1]WPO86383.1 MFS transporter [Herbiconiux sp. KACC 21604]
MRSPNLFGWLIAAAFTVMLNETMIGVALPALMSEFGASAASAQWLVSAYLLTIGCVLPLSGTIIDRLGPTRTLAVCSLMFAAGSVIALLSGQLWLLVLARVVQAAGGAALLPLLTTTVMRDSPRATRGRTMGAVSLVIGIAPACGPVVSGILLSAGDWRLLFIPSAVLSGAVAARTLPRWGSGVPRSVVRSRVDGASAALAVLAVGGTMVALDGVVHQLLRSTHGSTALLVAALALAAVGAVCAIAFVLRQRRLADRGAVPVLDLRAFAHPGLGRGATSIAVGMAGLFGVFALLPIVAITELGLEPVTAGLVMLPGGVLMGLLAPLVGRIAERVPPARLTVPGFAIMAAPTAGFALLDRGGVVLLLVLHLTLAVGFALTVTPLYLGSLAEQPPALLPHASTLLSTVQQVAAGAGTVAVIGISVLGPGVGFTLAAGLLAAAAATSWHRGSSPQGPRS